MLRRNRIRLVVETPGELQPPKRIGSKCKLSLPVFSFYDFTEQKLVLSKLYK